jgi:hypothetical protein
LLCFVCLTCSLSSCKGTYFHLKSLSFPAMEVKSFILPRHYYTTYGPLKRYAEQNEVRFKITDKKKDTYLKTALYLYENNQMEKPNIQSLGRWCMDSVCNAYRPAIIHSNMMKQQQQRQRQLQQPPTSLYQEYYTGDPTFPI